MINTGTKNNYCSSLFRLSPNKLFPFKTVLLLPDMALQNHINFVILPLLTFNVTVRAADFIKRGISFSIWHRGPTQQWPLQEHRTHQLHICHAHCNTVTCFSTSHQCFFKVMQSLHPAINIPDSVVPNKVIRYCHRITIHLISHANSDVRVIVKYVLIVYCSVK